jgi:hypothetical protein
MHLSEQQKRLDLAAELLASPLLAHETIFASRHSHSSAPFHREMIALCHDPAYPNVLLLAFRGSAKSTLLEETAALLAASGQVRNVLVIGDSWQRAVERLRSIKNELDRNEWLRYLCGDQAGDSWTESRVVLQNGCALSALGQGQALRGVKHLAARPDLCLVDDLESDESVATPDARAKLSDWFWADLIPALDPTRRLLMTATPLHPNSLAVTLSSMKQFKTLNVPIDYVDDEGVRHSSWPNRYPLHDIDTMKQTFIDAGKTHKWAAEYQMQAIDPATKMFLPEYFTYSPVLVRTWHPVYIAYDPARTVKSTSATTGIVVGSWVGRKLVIWEARAARYTPAQMVDDIFAMEQRYSPVVIAVEQDGLEEFLMEPLRHEQLKRSTLLPLRGIRAPKGKDEFIGRLQPLFIHHDITFAGTPESFADSTSQFLAFPTGLKDVPNAMAYLLTLREGTPVYDDTSERHIEDTILRMPSTYMLAVNASSYGSTAVLFQYNERTLRIHRDWSSEASASQALPSFIEQARLYAGQNVQVVSPPLHFDQRQSWGLLASLRGIAEVRKGGDVVKGRELIRGLLRGETRGLPRVMLGPDASWSRRAMTGGDVWQVGKAEPKEGLYSTLMRGLEAAIAPAAYSITSTQRVAYTEDGTPYNTAEVRRSY